MRRFLSTAAVVVAAAAAVAPITRADPTPRALITGCDALAPAGVPWTIRFKVERDTSSRYDLRYVKVEFWASGARLGTATTGKDGYASFKLDTPSTPGDLVVTGKLAPGSSYAAADQTLLVCVRSKTQRLFVLDIDQTISALPWAQVTQRSNDQLPPLEGAVEGVTDLARDAQVIYLTAREDNYRAKTKAWLSRWGFPSGPVFCSDSDRNLGTQAYKTNVLRELVPYFTNMKSGVGNKDTDAKAYNANGVASAMLRTQGGWFPSYAYVVDTWDELRAANAAGETPFLSWAKSFR